MSPVHIYLYKFCSVASCNDILVTCLCYSERLGAGAEIWSMFFLFALPINVNLCKLQARSADWPLQIASCSDIGCPRWELLQYIWNSPSIPFISLQECCTFSMIETIAASVRVNARCCAVRQFAFVRHPTSKSNRLCMAYQCINLGSRRLILFGPYLCCIYPNSLSYGDFAGWRRPDMKLSSQSSSIAIVLLCFGRTWPPYCRNLVNYLQQDSWSWVAIFNNSTVQNKNNHFCKRQSRASEQCLASLSPLTADRWSCARWLKDQGPGWDEAGNDSDNP